MKKTVKFYDFEQEFKNMGRGDQFSYKGLKALFEYLEEYEESTGEELEIDIISLCCDFTEYENIEEFRKDYGEEYETIEDIEYYTQVISIDEDSFIIQNF